MFGMFTGNFMSGFADEQDRLLGERQKLAQLFQDFKAQNPEASYSDYRAWIDGQTGGSAYLRGALPTDDLIRTLGQEGERRKAESNRLRSQKIVAADIDHRDTMRRLFREARANGQSPEKAIDWAVKTMAKGDPTMEQSLRQELSSYDPVQLYNEFDEEEVEKLLPQITAEIRAGGIEDPKQLEARLPDRIRKTQAGQRLLSTSTGLLSEYQRDRKAMITTQGLQMARQYGEDLTPEHTVAIVKELAPGINEAVVEQLARGLYTRAQEERKYQAQERGFAANDRRSRVAVGILSDENAMAIVQSGDEAAAKGLIARRFKMGGVDVTPADVAEIYEEMKGVAVAGQGQRFQAARNKVPEIVANNMAQNAKTFLASLPKPAKGDAVGEGVNQALRSLITTHWIAEGSGLDILAAVKGDKELSELAVSNPAALRERLAAAFPGVIKSRDEYTRDTEEQVGASQPQRLEDYVAAARTDIDQNFDTFTKRINDALKIDDPQGRRNTIQSIIDHATRWKAHLRQRIERSIADTSWYSLDSKKPKAAIPSELGSTYNYSNYRMEGLLRVAQEQLELANRRAQQPQPPAGRPAPARPAPAPPSGFSFAPPKPGQHAADPLGRLQWNDPRPRPAPITPRPRNGQRPAPDYRIRGW